MLNKRPTGNLKRDIEELFDELNLLTMSVNQPQKVGSARNEGKDGDLRFVEREDGNAYFMMHGRKGWYTTVTDIIQQAGNNLPRPHFKYLSVDNLFAKMFTINQTNAYNGNWLMSSGVAVVENVTSDTITFKDQTGLNVCPFMVDDKCEIRHVAADKSLTIKLSQFTVTAVSGRTITVTYESGHPIASVGDIVVQRGNASDTARQNAIYFSINDDDSPHIGLYTGLTGFALGTPTVAIGDLSGITDTDFSPDPLVGQGLYATGNVYIKGNIVLTNQGSISISGFNNDAGYITDADAGNITTYGSSAPLTPTTGDIWFDTSGGVDNYVMKRYNGTSWVVTSVYFDGNGAYIGNLTAGQVTAGTFTGLTFQTAAGSDRVVIEALSSNINFYSETDLMGYIGGGELDDLDIFATGKLLITTSEGAYLDGSEIATQSWVTSQGYVTGTPWTSEGYLDGSSGESYAEDPVTIGGISFNTAYINIGGVSITVLTP
jgi:hypothetical protein